MASLENNFAPHGWPRVVPRLFAHDPQRLFRFIEQVFGGIGEYRQSAPSEIRIGDSVLMLGDDRVRGARAAFLYVYVPDADAAYQRALDAGARSVEAPFDTPYGDRRGMVEDPWGNVWQIATHRATSASA